MFFICQTIVMFVIFDNSLYDCSEVIGNYINLKAINEKNCGISLFSTEPKLCLKYHNEQPLKLKDSRNALPKEAPWSVFLVIDREKSYDICSGVLFDRYWVMTAAHCLLDSKERITTDPIWVHLYPVIAQDILYMESEYWSSETKYIHHKYMYNKTQKDHPYDIGLFKLNKPVLIQPGVVNTICLPPERNFTYFEEQYAMTTGWHSIYKYKNHLLNRLQIASIKVSSHTKVIHHNEKGVNIPAQAINESHFIWKGFIFGTKLDKSKLCGGDSGSPVWQYYLGRAVLIGILSAADIDLNSTYKCQYENNTMYFPNGTKAENQNGTQSLIVWIPMIMDWVINITQNN